MTVTSSRPDPHIYLPPLVTKLAPCWLANSPAHHIPRDRSSPLPDRSNTPNTTGNSNSIHIVVPNISQGHASDTQN